jgi:ubiquinone/menaquinone biosynthesis C-methylase UbiE
MKISKVAGGDLLMDFDDYAKTWDTDKRVERAKIVANEISSSVGESSSCSAMEFGCGTGLVSFNLYDKFKDITLVDSSKAMIEVLHSKIDKCLVSNMTAIQLDILDHKSIEKKFDVIYSSMALHHIHDTKGIVKKFYELLNEDGYLCIVDLDEEDGSFHKNYVDYDGHNGFNQDELKSILRGAGFKDVKCNTFYYDTKVIDNEEIEYSLFIMKAQ